MRAAVPALHRLEHGRGLITSKEDKAVQLMTQASAAAMGGKE